MLLNIVVSLILANRDYDFYSHHNSMVSAMLIGAFLKSVVSEGLSFQVATSGVKLRGKKAVVRVMTVPETELCPCCRNSSRMNTTTFHAYASPTRYIDYSSDHVTNTV
jgi:hypothetical protein